MGNIIYSVKVMIPYWDYNSLKPTEYSPFRIIEIDPNTKLSEFAEIITNSFDFKNSKPYGFYYNNINNYLFAKEGYVMRFKDEDEWNTFDPDNIYGDVKKATVSDILTRKGKKWLLLFDYAKEWKIHVSLNEKLEKSNEKEYPIITETYMKSPLQNEFPQ